MTLVDEAYLATFLARPEWPRVRALLIGLGLSVERLDEVIARVRRNVWRDFSRDSSSRDQARSTCAALEGWDD